MTTRRCPDAGDEPVNVVQAGLSSAGVSVLTIVVGLASIALGALLGVLWDREAGGELETVIIRVAGDWGHGFLWTLGGGVVLWLVRHRWVQHVLGGSYDEYQDLLAAAMAERPTGAARLELIRATGLASSISAAAQMAFVAIVVAAHILR